MNIDNLTEEQRCTFACFWATIANDQTKIIEFALKDSEAQKEEIQAWHDERLVKLTSDKDSLNQDFIDSEHAKIDAEIAKMDDLINTL